MSEYLNPRHTQRMTLPEYLEMEKRSPTRHEYVKGHVYPLAQESIRHNDIISNLTLALKPPARAKKGKFVTESVRCFISKLERFYYPDMMVSCDPRDTDAFDLYYPCVVAEVVSPNSQHADIWEKVHAYTSLPTLNRYLLIYQDRPQIDVYSWAGTSWIKYSVEEGNVELPSLNTHLDLKVVYEGIEFDAK
ncbi:MAG: Uma2 family endonuclease [Deinococcaceae bacterium]